MNPERLKRANELHSQIKQLESKKSALETKISYEQKKEELSFRTFLKLFRKDAPREKKKMYYYGGIWYWTIATKEEALIELDVEDVTLLIELTEQRIEKLKEEFENV